MDTRNLHAALLACLAAVILAMGLAGTAGAQDQAGVTIEKSAVCQDVVDRQPVGVGDVFPKEISKVYCFTKVVGAHTETTITHNWYYNGDLKASVVLPVRSPSWRTWSSKTIDPSMTGEWMVEILAADGTALDSLIFYLR